MEEILRCTYLAPLASRCFVLCLLRVETEGLLDYQGRAGIKLYGGTIARSYSVATIGTRAPLRKHTTVESAVVSKLITDRHFLSGELISKYRYRIELPEEFVPLQRQRFVEISSDLSLIADTDRLLNSN